MIMPNYFLHSHDAPKNHIGFFDRFFELDFSQKVTSQKLRFWFQWVEWFVGRFATYKTACVFTPNYMAPKIQKFRFSLPYYETWVLLKTNHPNLMSNVFSIFQPNKRLLPPNFLGKLKLLMKLTDFQVIKLGFTFLWNRSVFEITLVLPHQYKKLVTDGNVWDRVFCVIFFLFFERLSKLFLFLKNYFTNFESVYFDQGPAVKYSQC